MIRYSNEDIIYSFFCKLMQEYDMDVALQVDPENKDDIVFRPEYLGNREIGTWGQDPAINFTGFNSLRRNIRINR